MVTTSIMDARAFYEKYIMVVGRPSTSRCDGKEYHGSCPLCGGTDRFAFWDSGRYSCSIRASGCGRAGRDVVSSLPRSPCFSSSFSSSVPLASCLLITRSPPSLCCLPEYFAVLSPCRCAIRGLVEVSSSWEMFNFPERYQIRCHAGEEQV
jgi:Zinc-binding domain of primase-helicase